MAVNCLVLPTCWIQNVPKQVSGSNVPPTMWKERENEAAATKPSPQDHSRSPVARVPVSAMPLTWEALGTENSTPSSGAVLHLSSPSDPTSQMRKLRLGEGTQLAQGQTPGAGCGEGPCQAQQRPREGPLLLAKAPDLPSLRTSGGRAMLSDSGHQCSLSQRPQTRFAAPLPP